MRKAFMFLSLLMSICLLKMPILAEESVTKVGDGYTPDGIYFEVFAVDEQNAEEISMYSAGITVTREVVYYGNIIPPSQYYWREGYAGAYYSGMLNLRGYVYDSEKTIATYKGRIYRE